MNIVYYLLRVAGLVLALLLVCGACYLLGGTIEIDFFNAAQKTLSNLPRLGKIIEGIFSFNTSLENLNRLTLLQEITFGLLLVGLYQLMQLFSSFPSWIIPKKTMYAGIKVYVDFITNMVCCFAAATGAVILQETTNMLVAGSGTIIWTIVLALILLVIALLTLRKRGGAAAINVLYKLLLDMLILGLIFMTLLTASIFPVAEGTTMVVSVIAFIVSVLLLTILGAKSLAGLLE